MTLPAADQRALEAAVRRLEQPSLAARLANHAGKPLDRAMKFLPLAQAPLHKAVHDGLLKCLNVAIGSRDGQDFALSCWRAKALTGATGAIGGLFGALFLPLELPLTLTIMLRAIVDIANGEGEDLRDIESRLACLHVFGMSDRKTDTGAAVGYYAARATLSRTTAALVASLAQRGAVDASGPVAARMVAEVAGRFGFVLSERAAAGAIPVIGAFGGAALNVIFTDYFERIARGHFAIRRL